MAKVSGIKGINISKSSVLKDGSKKTSGNENFRDTSNGTTRDNSGNNAFDAATLKMLLGQTELMAKKAQQIEQNMRIAQRKEEERQKQVAERLKEKEKRDREKEEKDSERKFDSYYDKIDRGIINGGLASIFGPGAVMLGKGLNAMGLPLERWGKKLVRKGGAGAFNLIKRAFGKKEDNEEGTAGSGNGENALSVNRREEAAEPVNKLKSSITKRLDKIINILERNGGSSATGEKRGGWLDNLKSFFDGLGNGLLGRLFGWLGPKLLYLAGLTGMGYALHKLWEWAKDKFGPNWADGIVAGISQALKGALKGAGAGLEKAANSLKALRKGAFSSKGLGALSKTLDKLANSGKVGKFLFGNAAEKAAKSARAASIAAQSGKLGKTGSALLGAGKTLSKLGRAAGIVGNVVIAGEAGYDAYQKFKAGDKRGGYGAIGRGAGAIGGGSLGAWGGAGVGAAIGTAILPGIGTAVGGLLGGIAGALGLGYAGSKLGEKLGEKGYDWATGTSPAEVRSEGQLTTEGINYNALEDMQTQQLQTNLAILDSLEHIELSLSPQVQRDLDNAYIDSVKRGFTITPEASETNYFNEYGTLGMAWNDAARRDIKG